MFALLQFWLGLASISIPPNQKNYQPPKKQDPKRPKWAQIFLFFLLGLILGGFEPNSSVVGQDNPQSPRGMTTSREQETSINLRDVCVQQQQKRGSPQLFPRWRRWAAFDDCLRAQSTYAEARAAAAGRRWAAATLVRVFFCQPASRIEAVVFFSYFSSFYKCISNPKPNFYDLGSRKQFQIRLCFDHINSLWKRIQSKCGTLRECSWIGPILISRLFNISYTLYWYSICLGEFVITKRLSAIFAFVSSRLPAQS